jgi:hypothetical protein
LQRAAASTASDTTAFRKVAVHERTARPIRLSALVIGLVTTARTAAAQAPAVTKAGLQAVLIAFVGQPTPTGGADTTTLLAGREEMQRFLAVAQATRAHQPGTCPTGDAPTLGGTGNGWTLRLTCARSSTSPAEWRLVYVDATTASAAGHDRDHRVGGGGRRLVGACRLARAGAASDAAQAAPAGSVARRLATPQRHRDDAVVRAHSSRNETTGSTLAARWAGTQQASAAAETSSAQTPAYVGRSSDVTP